MKLSSSAHDAAYSHTVSIQRELILTVTGPEGWLKDLRPAASQTDSLQSGKTTLWSIAKFIRQLPDAYWKTVGENIWIFRSDCSETRSIEQRNYTRLQCVLTTATAIILYVILCATLGQRSKSAILHCWQSDHKQTTNWESRWRGRLWIIVSVLTASSGQPQHVCEEPRGTKGAGEFHLSSLSPQIATMMCEELIKHRASKWERVGWFSGLVSISKEWP